MQQTFKKEEKLKSKKFIDALFVDGKSVSQYPVRLVYKEFDFEEKDIQIKAGVSVSKKLYKKAVDRNHLKRLLRESYRKNKYLVLTGTDRSFAFMFLYVGKNKLDSSIIDSSLERVLQKFLKKERKDT